MAEFQEVMRQLNRMCSHYQNCRDSGCPLFDECGNIGSYSSNAKQVMRIEKCVMSWAAEHPEPVYPTWGEWLIKIGGAVKKLYAQQYHYKAAQPTQLIEVVEVLDEPIPADIAQKLEIDPKEE